MSRYVVAMDDWRCVVIHLIIDNICDDDNFFFLNFSNFSKFLSFGWPIFRFRVFLSCFQVLHFSHFETNTHTHTK